MGTHPIFESDFDCLTEMVKANVVSGKTASGRPWKSGNRKPIHTMTTTKNVKPTWEKKMQMKRDKLAMKSRETELRQKRNEEKETERIRIDEKRKLAAENEEKQNRMHGQVVLDPKKQKKYEAQEKRRIRKLKKKKAA